MFGTLDPTARRGAYRLLAACIGTMGLNDVALWLRPAVNFSLLNEKGFSEQAAGAVSTTEMLFVSATMLIASRYVHSVRFLTLSLFAVVLAVAMSVLSIVAETLPLMMVARGGAAIGFGLLALVPYAAAARLPNPQKGYSYLFTGGAVLGFVALASLPFVEELVSHSAAFIGYIAFTALMMPLVLMLPPEAKLEKASADAEQKAMSKARWRNILILSIGVSVIGISYQGVWSFLYYLAKDTGLPADRMGLLVAATTLSCVAGSLTSSWMTKTLGRDLFLYATIVGLSICLAALLFITNAILFSATALFAMFLLFSFYPAVFGIAAAIDESGRGVGFLQGFTMLVAAVGPVITGTLFEAGLRGVIAGGIAVLALVTIVIFAKTLSLFPSKDGVPATT